VATNGGKDGDGFEKRLRSPYRVAVPAGDAAWIESWIASAELASLVGRAGLEPATKGL
jgi:hypothetical protein